MGETLKSQGTCCFTSLQYFPTEAIHSELGISKGGEELIVFLFREHICRIIFQNV